MINNSIILLFPGDLRQNRSTPDPPKCPCDICKMACTHQTPAVAYDKLLVQCVVSHTTHGHELPRPSKCFLVLQLLPIPIALVLDFPKVTLQTIHCHCPVEPPPKL